MHSNQPNFPGKPMLPVGNQVSYYMQNARMASLFDGPVAHRIPPLSNVDIQTSDACPRNFIIFDQSNNRSQIMLHPGISSRMFYPGLSGKAPIFQGKVNQKDATNEVASLQKEDSDDIDALLSTEYEEDEESGDEVSTARTNAIYECSSPESGSNYGSASKKSRPLFRKSCGSDKKRQRVKKMVKALRGIVPGANQMSSVAVLDEAVRYLKSLRVEVKKLGIGNWNE